MGPKKGSHQIRMLRIMGSFEMKPLVSYYAGVAQDRFSEIPGNNLLNVHSCNIRLTFPIKGSCNHDKWVSNFIDLKPVMIIHFLQIWSSFFILGIFIGINKREF